MEKKTDLTKPVQTEDKRKARVICTDRKCEVAYPVIALVESGGIEEPYKYTEDGRFLLGERHELDLVNVPEKHTYYLHLLRVAAGTKVVPEKFSRAGDSFCSEMIARKKIEFEEGQFDA